MPKNVLVAMALVLFVVAFISLQKGLEKGNFIDGMWSNSKEGVYVYIIKGEGFEDKGWFVLFK